MIKKFLGDVAFALIYGVACIITAIMCSILIVGIIGCLAIMIGVALFPVVLLSTMFSGWSLFWMSAWVVPTWVMFLIASQHDFEERFR